MISVLIPSRNEFLLKKTIETTLEASEGEIEIVAVCDGYWPDPPIGDDDRVILIHHSEPVGQRQAVNEAAGIAKGKYILKTDGHSTFDKGFDIKLAADCEYDWTVIPRMYNLHAFDWVCKNNHRFYQDKADPHKENKCPDCNEIMEIEYVWKIRKHKKTDFMRISPNLRVQYWNNYKKRDEAKGDIVDVMNGQGACWFQHKDRFLELGGLDEKHGSWGQVGVEVAMKAWLSGGRHVVNKKTWFAHMFRTTGSFSFPYKIRASAQEYAREYSRDLWLNDKWPMATRKFQWLIDKFSPIPDWPDEKGKIEMEDYKLITVDVDKVYKNRIKHTEYRKTRDFYINYNRRHPNLKPVDQCKANPDKSIENFFEAFEAFVKHIFDPAMNEANGLYHRYLLNHLNPKDLLPELSKKGQRRLLQKIKDATGLCESMKEHGMRDPLSGWSDGNGSFILRKGHRRLVILKELGVKEALVKAWKDEESFYRGQNDLRHTPKAWRRKLAN